MKISRILKFLLAMTLLTAGLLSAGWYFGNRYLLEWSRDEIRLPVPVEIQFERGMRLESLATLLEKQQLIDHAELFRIWVRLYSNPRGLQAGRYRFEDRISPAAIADQLLRGSVYRPVVLSISIPEGFTTQKIFERIAANTNNSSETLNAAASSVLQNLQERVPEASSLEGFLYPATYAFYETPSAQQVLEKMLRTFFEKLPMNYQQDIEERELSLFDAVTFASLIELETGLDEERSIVSEVIWNRLDKGMALGIDAAIIYGIDDYQGDITFQHLRDKSNPYNLRHRRGLPPTPICSPSAASLAAVLTPTDYGYFYYVRKAGAEGAHHFSKTFKEHKQWVRKWVKHKKGK